MSVKSVKLDDFKIDILRRLVLIRDQHKLEFDRAQQAVMAYINQCAKGDSLSLDEYQFDDATLSFVAKGKAKVEGAKVERKDDYKD